MMDSQARRHSSSCWDPMHLCSVRTTQSLSCGELLPWLQAFKEAWKVEPQAWLHASSAQGLEEKVALLKREGAWALEDSYQAPSCTAHAP